jgi:hypothetical protein
MIMAFGGVGLWAGSQIKVSWHIVALTVVLSLIALVFGAYSIRVATTKDRWKLEVSRDNLRLCRTSRPDDGSLNVDISAGARVRVRRSEDSVPTSNGGRVWFSVFQVLMVAGGREFQIARFGSDTSVWLALHIEQCLRKVLPPPADSPSPPATDAEEAQAETNEENGSATNGDAAESEATEGPEDAPEELAQTSARRAT